MRTSFPGAAWERTASEDLPRDDSKRVMADKQFKIRRNTKEWLPGKFVHRHDVCFDKDGNIFVVEWVDTGRVTFLRHVG